MKKRKHEFIDVPNEDQIKKKDKDEARGIKWHDNIPLTKVKCKHCGEEMPGLKDLDYCEQKEMKILQAIDRQGWATSKVSRPIADLNDNVDAVYIGYKPERYLDTGYDDKNKVVPYTKEKANKYDIVHFHHTRCSKELVKRLKKGIRKILSVHNERDIHEDYNWSDYDDIICPTKYCYEEMKKKHKRVHLVPYGIDLNKYNYQFKDALPDTVGYVGRVISHKRFDVVKREVYKAGMTLIGTGYIEEPEVFTRYPEVSRDKDFKYTIFLPERQMNDFYAKMQIFVSISEPHNETGPLPVLEAMAAGVPVISTKTGWALDNATHNSNIIFIDESQIDRLHDIIKGLNKNVDLKNRLRSNAIRLMEDYSIENYVNKIMKIYEKTI